MPLAVDPFMGTYRVSGPAGHCTIEPERVTELVNLSVLEVGMVVRGSFLPIRLHLFILEITESS